MSNLDLKQAVLVYMLNSRRQPSPALFAPGQYLAPRAHEEQAHYVVNTKPHFTLAEAVALNPCPPVPPAFAE